MSKSEVKQLCYMTYNNFGRTYKQMELVKATIMEWITNGAAKVEIVILEHESMSNLKKENEELKARVGKLEEVLYAAENLISYETPLAMSPKAAAMKRYERAMKALKEDEKGMHNDTY